MSKNSRLIRPRFVAQSACIVVLTSFLMVEHCASQTIEWDFSTPVTPGPGGHRLPPGWRVFVPPTYDLDGSWLFVNPSSPGGSATGAGGDSELKFNNPNDPPDGGPDVDSSLFTPSFRFTDLSKSLISIVGVDFFNGEGVPETDRIEFSLVAKKDNQTDENDDEGILILNATPDAGPSPPLDAQLPVGQLGGAVNTHTYYRVRIRALDMDAFQSMGGTTVESIVITNGILESTNPDYNRDGAVNAADYVVWRNAVGTSDLRADGNGDGVVNLADYQFWKSSFGLVFGQSASQDSGTLEAVPELSTCSIVVLAALLICPLVSRHVRR